MAFVRHTLFFSVVTLATFSIAVSPLTSNAQELPIKRDFTTDISMVEFVRSKGYTIGINPAFDPALRGDAATELKVCQMAGYTTVTFKTDTNRFTSPADNEIAYWNGSTFITNNATSVQGVYNPAKLDNLTCSSPNLISQNLKLSNNNPIEGDTITFSAKTNNNGLVTAGVSRSTFCVDNANDNCKNSADGRLFYYGHDIPSLAPDQSSATFTSIGWTATPGTHTVKACSDVNNQVTESNESENDNCASVTFTVTGTPNLISENLTVPTNILVGQQVRFTANAKNNGSATAASSKSAFCVDNTNNNCKSSFDGRIPGPGNDVASLAAGQSSAIFTSDPWTATAGSHTVKVCADVNDNVPESNETEDDNCMSKDFTVTAPPPTSTVVLQANNSNGPTTVASGARVVMSWTSTNADWCWAEEPREWRGWKEPVAEGSEQTPPLTSSATYPLACGRTGETGVSDSVTVNVASAPTVSITGPCTTLPSNCSSPTEPTLYWSSMHTTSCTASNGWTGSKALNSPASGEAQQPITSTTTYVLECTGPGGTTRSSVTVNIARSNAGGGGNSGGSTGNSSNTGSSGTFQETR